MRKTLLIVVAGLTMVAIRPAEAAVGEQTSVDFAHCSGYYRAIGDASGAADLAELRSLELEFFKVALIARTHVISAESAGKRPVRDVVDQAYGWVTDTADGAWDYFSHRATGRVLLKAERRCAEMREFGRKLIATWEE